MITADTITAEQIRALIESTRASHRRLNADRRATITDAQAALRGDRTCRARCAEILNERAKESKK